MAQWTLEHRVFVLDSYVKNKGSVTEVQREFRRHINIHLNNTVPTRNTILYWVTALRTRCTLMNRKPFRVPQTVGSQENVERGREALLPSLNRSARRHSIERDISWRSSRQFLHEKLHFQPATVAATWL